ncbi:hypothetical protein DW094_11470 [Ruminococcaceae bacterium AM07-15]|nr:hypothetical protein DW094_11470 [Ruminococcaceae bacterium AM07-15]
MTAQALGPGDGLSHPEHRGITAHTAFSEFWVQRHAACDFFIDFSKKTAFLAFLLYFLRKNGEKAFFCH